MNIYLTNKFEVLLLVLACIWITESQVYNQQRVQPGGPRQRQPAPVGQPQVQAVPQPQPRRQPQPAMRQPQMAVQPRPPQRAPQAPPVNRQPANSPRSNREANPGKSDDDIQNEENNSPAQPNRPATPKRIDIQNTVCQTKCRCQQTAAVCQGANLRSIPEPFPQGIDQILLDRNFIDAIPPNFFSTQMYSSIQKLTMNENRLTKIKENTFTGLSNLRELSIASNKITSIEKNAFGGLRNLGTVVLNGNKIKKIDPSAFGSPSNIRSLALENNNLETVSSELLENLPYVQTLSIGGNPFVCDCKMLSLLLWLMTGKGQLQGTAPICSEPEKYYQKNLQSFAYNELEELCSDDKEDEDGTNEPSEEELMEEGCLDHNSTKAINICYISSNITVLPGEKVCLLCSATTEYELVREHLREYKAPAVYEDYGYDDDSPYSEPTITWEIPNAIDQSDSRIQSHENGSFCISSIWISDTGDYKCVAKIGNLSDERTVTLEVFDLPNRIAVGLAVIFTLSIVLTVVLLVRWWSAEVAAFS